MKKLLIREIKGSLGRFLAIFFIVALGVAFFSGTKVTDIAMIETADQYLKKHQFYDYWMASTIGFDEDTAETFLSEEDVAAVEGNKEVDAIAMDPLEKEEVFAVYELPTRINVPEVISGALPETDTQCVLDGKYYDESCIGKTITISPNNDEDTLDRFSQRSFTVTGIVNSPLYFHYNRGNSSVGDGTVKAFLYVKEDAFDMDFDTAIYVRFQGTEEKQIYSDAYDDYLEEKRDTWETMAKNASKGRFDRIYQDAMDEYKDGKAEFDKEIAKAQKELDDGKKELDDGKKEISDGEKALSEGIRKLDRAQKQINQNRKQYDSGYQKYQDGLKKYKEGKKAFDKGKKILKNKFSEYDAGLKKYQAGLEAYENGLTQYEEGYEQYTAIRDFLPEEERISKDAYFAGLKKTLDDSKTELDSAKTVLDAGKKELDQAKSTVDANEKKLNQSKKTLDASKRQLETAKKQLEDGQKEIDKGREEIKKNRKKLDDAKEKLEKGEKEYQDGLKEFREKKEDGEKELADAKAKIDDLSEPSVYLLDGYSNMGFASFENDSAIVGGVSKVFPVFFLLVAALVIMTTMSRMIDEQRTQLGVMKALGYSDMAVIGKYLAYSGIAAVSGALFGYFSGCYAFPVAIWTAYKMMYELGSIRYIIEPSILVVSMIVAVISSMGVTWLCCCKELKETAASLMRPKAPKPGKRILLERITFLWNRMNFLRKVSFRNLFRYKNRFFMMIIGISGCTALLVTGFGIRDSVTNIAELQFGKVFTYDSSATLKDEQIPEMVEGVEEWLNLSTLSEIAKKGRYEKEISLLTIKDDDSLHGYINLYDENESALPELKDGEAFITEKLADNLDVKIGDTITLRDDERGSGEVKVAGIYQNYFMNYVILRNSTFRKLFHSDATFNTLYINLKENADVYETAASLMKDEAVTAVSNNIDIRNNVSDMMKSMDFIIIVIIVSAAALAFIVIYNLNNINITERVREIATIKVLGFYKNETRQYIFRENIVLTILGAGAGLFLGYLLHRFVMSKIVIDAVSFDVTVHVSSYIIAFILTLVFNWLINLFMSGKLEKIDMAESLKSIE